MLTRVWAVVLKKIEDDVGYVTFVVSEKCEAVFDTDSVTVSLFFFCFCFRIAL